MPNINEIEFDSFLPILIMALMINYFLFRRLLFAISDPIWIFVIINTSITIALIVHDRYLSGDYITIIYLCACQLCFVVFARLTKSYVLSHRQIIDKTYNRYIFNARSARWMLNISTLVLTPIFLYYAVVGLPILSSDPELARVMTRTEGGGMLTRLINVFSFLGLTMWFYIRLEKIDISFGEKLLGILIPVLVLLTLGSKASLINVYIAYFSVSYFLYRETGDKRNISMKYLVYTALAILVYTYIHLSLRALEVSTVSSTEEFAMDQLMQRIVFSGIGAFHYFSTYIPEFDNLNALDYMYQYIVLPLLAPLRILPYESTIGSMLAVSMVGDETFGPNPSMYVEGKIFFGWIVGVFYCGFLGVLFSYFRYFSLNLNRIPLIIRVTFFSFGCMLVQTITYDTILFVGELYNAFFLLLPIVVALLYLDKISTRV